MQKVVRDGKIAVIYCTDFGQGWESAVVDEVGEEAYFCPAIVEKILERDASEKHLKQWAVKRLAEVINKQYPQLLTGDFFAERIFVEWVPQGTRFFIHDYDGCETVCIITPDFGILA